ncbi:cytoplasmic protein [Mycena floridula]|nr:cytoplasmic protein [Mycena floridula]
MSFVISIFQTIASLLCGKSNSPEQQEQQQHHPPAQQQQQPSHHAPVHYPPAQQQQHPHKTPHQTGPHHAHSDPNQENQHNEYYMSLRKRANEEGDKMAQAFQRSHEAYAQKDGAGAKELSNQGKEHQRQMERLNKEASDWIFIENNKDSKPGEIDLHGLYVREAIAHTDAALQEAKQRGDSEVRLIVGKGLHSQGGAAKIKPAIEELMQKHQLVANLDPHNSGVLIVRINADGRGVDPEEISRRLERKDECTIM